LSPPSTQPCYHAAVKHTYYLGIPKRILSLTILMTACGTPPEADVTWHADVQPMLDAQCIRCHDGGGLGPGDFTHLDTVRLLADRMSARMEDGTMPPPAADPACNPYVGDDRLTIDDKSIELFADWVALGAEEGTLEGAPTKAEPIAVTFDDWDLEVRIPACAPT
jgi:hypothetical protein